MRFLLDESVDARLLPHLRGKGHEVARLATDYPAGLSDDEVLVLAQEHGRILITNDTDFGELVFRHRRPHAGVILFRLGAYVPLQVKIERLEHVLAHYRDQLDHFLVVFPERVRVAQDRPPRS